MATINEENFGFLEKAVKLVNKYGIIAIFKALLVIAAFGYIMFNISNFDKIISSAIIESNEAKINEHDKALEYRRSINPEINHILNDVLQNLEADRIFLLELHNGTNNTAGLPFIYAEMTYSMVNEGITHIDEDYTNLNLSRFKFPLFLSENDVWYGNMEELKKIDEKLAGRLTSNDVKYFCIVTLHGRNTELGYFGITYCRDYDVNIDDVLRKVTVASQKLSSLLDHK